MTGLPNRLTTITLATILVVAILAAPLGGAAAIPASSGVQETDADGSANESIQPGAQFAGVVGVQQAEINGSVSERAYAAELATAENNESKAAIIDERIATTETRLATLERRLATLNESREAGELNDGRYRAAVAKTVAEIRSLERELETVESAAADVPDRVLAEQGVDRDAIRTLRERASELDGPETAAAARSIAGDGAGRAFGPERQPGPPIDVDDRRGGDGAGPDGAVPGRGSDGAANASAP
ncbi:hypothetical protein [Halopiger xanaduensis]|uniref:Uncharacterized protein n=1 Tax=Halopiger xanaduensis (strain DSM 18323 / JCM 14033 / SH-6) TaxID=797210 RepID=F8D6U1_HALXS|nr:hypothetical protein [Halopiger xanaduensis]AEH35768.1 hypothetical protein Halxa_1134 [Halopiger xanaduensis SH-6]